VEESVEKEGKCAGESTCLARSNAHVQGKLTMLVVLTNHFGPQQQEREHASAIAPTRFARTRVALRVSSPKLVQRAEPNRCGAADVGVARIRSAGLLPCGLHPQGAPERR